MIDLCADGGWLATTLRTMHIVQMIIQGCWLHDCSLIILPSITPQHLSLFVDPCGNPIDGVAELVDVVQNNPDSLVKMLKGSFSTNHIEHVSR